MQYSPLVLGSVKESITKVPHQQSIKSQFTPDRLPLSELPLLLNKQLTLDVPVYTVWGACEDVRVLEKFRSGEYKVHNLHIIDEASSRLLDVGGVKLRLLGLGGAVVMHKLFDNGEGKTTIAGGQGTMWTTLLQMGELVDTANRVYDPSETRIFVTHASPAREGMLNQLSVILKADFSISAGLHFRYGSSYNEFSVNPTLDHYRGKLAASKASFNDVWDTVKSIVESEINSNEAQRTLLDNALDIVSRMPTVANGGNPFGGPVTGSNAGGQVDESAFKNMWNFNLADAAFGWLVLEIENGRIGTEMRAQGFNFSHRTGKVPHPPLSQSIFGPSVPGSAPPRPANPPQFGQAPPARGTPSFSQQAAPTPTPQKPATPPKPASPAPAPASATPQLESAPTPSNDATPAESTDKKESDTNGTGQAEKSAEKPADKSAEKKATSALFIANVESEQTARELFPQEDRDKIVKVDKWGKFNHVVSFSSSEEAKDVLERLSPDHKKPSPPGPNRKPHVKMFEERPSRREGGNAGSWQSSNRGSGGPRASGYQSGSATSDTEGGRGRGGYSGRGRGRGGERGRGRGGRGGFNKGNSGSHANSDTASAASTPAGEKPKSGGDS